MRMFNAIEEALDDAEWVVLVGTDCPGWTLIDLADAASQLTAGTDCVLGPALDGGYYLIGLRRNHLSLFTDMPWGSDRVFALTVQRLRALGWRLSRLPAYRDIDRPEDLDCLPDEWKRPGQTGKRSVQ